MWAKPRPRELIVLWNTGVLPRARRALIWHAMRALSQTHSVPESIAEQMSFASICERIPSNSRWCNMYHTTRDHWIWTWRTNCPRIGNRVTITDYNQEPLTMNLRTWKNEPQIPPGSPPKWIVFSCESWFVLTPAWVVECNYGNLQLCCLNWRTVQTMAVLKCNKHGNVDNKKTMCALVQCSNVRIGDEHRLKCEYHRWRIMLCVA